jgi:inner membrane protein involved in colicin E2 resistance
LLEFVVGEVLAIVAFVELAFLSFFLKESETVEAVHAVDEGVAGAGSAF